MSSRCPDRYSNLIRDENFEKILEFFLGERKRKEKKRFLKRKIRLFFTRNEKIIDFYFYR